MHLYRINNGFVFKFSFNFDFMFFFNFITKQSYGMKMCSFELPSLDLMKSHQIIVNHWSSYNYFYRVTEPTTDSTFDNSQKHRQRCSLLLPYCMAHPISSLLLFIINCFLLQTIADNSKTYYGLLLMCSNERASLVSYIISESSRT